MSRVRAWMMVMIGLVAALLVSCSGPTTTVKIPTTYSNTQLDLISNYLTTIEDNSVRLGQLEAGITAGDWQTVRTVMRGPLGQMILDMRNLNRNLLTKDQKPAIETTRGIVTHLLALDQAAIDEDIPAAQKAFKAVKQDYEDYLKLVPQV
ncbi:photosystem II protein PsbQ [Synechococcus sp. PCC 6312]|uniref:photosystem II protein PsbQ n=1 Tax=Synechococcus sp. (strain ATCC 27167 / PCC 6312) TaxID=195253 RepID=UPI00029F1E03|nr:photosystem II protein PsbQ [Synechococcus sp. PCC 6312]AFY62149.1 photosystem II protein PsbQ [Synechococcus sp. PCC 6312]